MMTQQSDQLNGAAPGGASGAQTEFELPIYADATLAGLTPLVPLPLLDWWLEGRFQRRMLTSIARHRGRELAPAVRQVFTTGDRNLVVAGLLFLLKLPLRLGMRLLGKLVYILAIKEATERTSFYWQRAFLIDHMLRAGHLEDVESARRAYQAMEQAMRGLPSPLTALARQLVQRIWRMRPFRRSSAQELRGVAAEQRGFMASQWAEYAGFLRQLAARYDQAYATQRRELR